MSDIRLPLTKSLKAMTCLGAASLASFVLTPDALAQRAVTLSTEAGQDYARIVTQWADGDEVAPQIETDIENRVLILKFAEPVTLDLQPVRDNLPEWVALARLDSDGLTARIALRKQDTRVHKSTSIDRTAIDILEEENPIDPPDIVSPLVAARAQAKEAAKIAEIPPPVEFLDELIVRASEADGRSRIAFYWTKDVEFKQTVQGNQLQVKFNVRAEPDIAHMRIDPPAQVQSLGYVNDDRGMFFSIDMASGVEPNIFKEEKAVIIDLPSRQARIRAAKEEQERNAALAQESETPEAIVEVKADPVPQIEKQETESQDTPAGPVNLVLPKANTLPQETQFGEASEALGMSRHIDVDRGGDDPAQTTRDVYSSNSQPKAGQSGGDQHHASNLGPRQSFYRGEWAEPAPLSKSVKAEIKPLSNGMNIIIPWQAPAPVAVFSRPPAVWAVFAVDADIEIDPDQIPTRYNIETIRQERAVLLRVEMPEGMVASASSAETTWTLTFAPASIQPERFLKPVREVSETGRFSIETPLIGAAGVVWFEDPVVGDEIAAAVAFAPTSASATKRMFVEAEMPATAHGLAIIPHADDVTVKLVDERVVVTSSRGMAVSDAATGLDASYKEMNSDTPTPSFIDFDAWGGMAGGAFFARKSELARAAAARDPASKAGSDVLIDLARFYVGHDLGAEAVGVLQTALDGRPLLEQEAAYLGLRGAAYVMMKRFKEAEADLSKGALRGDKSAQIWRGYVAAEMGQWERSNDFFRGAEELIFAYTGRWAARFYAKAAEAAFRNNELDRARQLAGRAAGTSYREPAENASLLLARVNESKGELEKAYGEYSALTRDAIEPVAVKAELRRLALGAKLDKVTPSEAAEQLDTLRYRWRGDANEMETVGILADQYMSLGRFREALLLTQSAALRNADEPGARELRIRLVDFFRRLYLDGEADRLDPIQALALYYEFKGLTPIGQDGDRMIRNLARRLVAFDLLDPATELLQHQIDNRVRGRGKAVIAVDLASIYLMDRQPDRALAAIAASRQPRLPRDLALQRRLLEGAAYRDMGRYDHAIELLEGVEGLEAASIRADAYWKGEQWAEAARQLASMLPPKDQVTDRHLDLALKTAIAGRLAKDMGLLAQLSEDYSSLFTNTANEQSFALITSQTDISGAALSEAVRRLADAPKVDAFASSLKKRFEGEG